MSQPPPPPPINASPPAPFPLPSFPSPLSPSKSRPDNLQEPVGESVNHHTCYGKAARLQVRACRSRAGLADVDTISNTS